MEETKVSIIIPVYNTGLILENCLNSISNQSYPNFEAIIVDDGSEDESLSTAKKYEKADSRFQVYSKENEGVSATRNYGIKRATGDYICFVDSDDTISANFLEILLKQKNMDCVAGGLEYTNKERTIVNLELQIYDTDNIGNLLSKKLQSMYFLSAWGKLYKTSIIKKYNIHFDTKLRLGEDTLFLHNYLSSCKSFCTTGEVIYTYHIDAFSYKKYSLQLDQTLYAINQIIDIYHVLCHKFHFQNESYFLYIVRHYMLAYQQYCLDNLMHYNSIKRLYQNQHVRSTLLKRKSYSRFNKLQSFIIKNSLYYLSFIICKIYRKLIV